jgi:hypothetical protein
LDHERPSPIVGHTASIGGHSTPSKTVSS